MAFDRNVRDAFNRLYLDDVVRDPAATGFVLSTLLDVEQCEEVRFFDRVEPLVDAQLRKAVRRHREDEDRHARMLAEALDALGLAPVSVPEALRPLARIDREAGGFVGVELETREELGRAYLMLYVLERRMVERLAWIVCAFERPLPRIARVLERIRADERRHVGYCEAVSRRLLRDERAWDALRARMIAADARVWQDYSLDQLDFMLDHVFEDLGPAKRAMWRAVAAVGRLRHVEVPVVEVAPLRRAA